MMYISQDKVEFLERWTQKGEAYDLDDLSDCFDAFFTIFVIYNFLYNLVAHHHGLRDHDRKKATEVVRELLGVEVIAGDQIIKSNAAIVLQFISEGSFFLKAWDSDFDSTQIKNLASDQTEEFSEGILQVLYEIRCTMFHGEKPMEESQKDILIPCVEILRRLNDLMVTKLRADQT